MANALTTLTNTVLAQMAVDAATEVLAPLFAFTRDFSPEAAQRGDKVKVLYVPTQDAAIDFAGTYVMQDADATGKDVSLDKHKFVSWGLSDQELANRPQLSLEAFARQKGHQLAKAVLQDVLSLVTIGNYGANVFNDAASNFDSDDVADIRKACVDDGMPDFERYLILTPAYVAALLKDDSIKGNDAFGGSDPIRRGIIGTLMGFNIVETPVVPGNGEDLIGMAAFPTGIFVANRYLVPGAGSERIIEATPVVNAATGLTFGYRQWYDANAGTAKSVLECVYGYQVGDPAMVKRMES
jgi:hypothetical protein